MLCLVAAERQRLEKFKVKQREVVKGVEGLQFPSVCSRRRLVLPKTAERSAVKHKEYNRVAFYNT